MAGRKMAFHPHRYRTRRRAGPGVRPGCAVAVRLMPGTRETGPAVAVESNDWENPAEVRRIEAGRHLTSLQ